jgi:hypothetical protein
MGNEQAAPETKGVTVELLAALDLGHEMTTEYGPGLGWPEDKNTTLA